jgi:hypothetical protein
MEEALTAWARQQAAELRERSGKLSGQTHPAEVRHIAARGIAFLEDHAPGTEFAGHAGGLFEMGTLLSGSSAVEALAQILEAWADYIEAGLVPAVPFEVQARVEAATDLMEQVQRLLDDKAVHVAAPVVLAGAALEEFLRSMLAAHPEAVVKGKPGLQSYVEALRAADVVSTQDVKDVTAWAGQRNAAAHGEFEDLTRARAHLMADGINLFMRQKTP